MLLSNSSQYKEQLIPEWVSDTLQVSLAITMGGKKFRKETDKNMSASSKKNLRDSV